MKRSAREQKGAVPRAARSLSIMRRWAGLLAAMMIGFAWGLASDLAAAESCSDVVAQLHRQLHPRTDEAELVAVIESLNKTGRLPDKFVTKREARHFGWSPGTDLWLQDGLRGKSIGGDPFNNREGKLPHGGRRWREADLDYRGGRRGAKRLIYSDDGRRWITVDHYRSFVEIPACQ